MADETQLKRLKKYIRCKKRIKGEVVKCNRAFFNFNLDMIDDVESSENYYAFIGHANYEELGYQPEVNNPKLTHFIGVSQFSTDKLDEWCKRLNVNTNAIRCYNPLTLEPKQKVIRLVSACRLEDKVKGGERTLKLIKALDRYCESHNRNYIWTIYTNTPRVKIKSPNVAIMKPRVDVRPYIADADYVLQLSNNMETYCYTINEALSYGVSVVTTPLSIMKELPVTDNEHITLDWDCNNANEVARQIFEKEVKPFKYTPPKDEWDKLLAKGESAYKEELKMKYLVEATNKYKATNTFDTELSKQKGVAEYFPTEGEQWEVDMLRKDLLIEKGFVKVVKEIKEEVVIEEDAIISEKEAEQLKEDEVADVKAKKVTVKKTTTKKTTKSTEKKK